MPAIPPHDTAVIDEPCDTQAPPQDEAAPDTSAAAEPDSPVAAEPDSPAVTEPDQTDADHLKDPVDASVDQRFESVLCRNWAIVPEALLELTARLGATARVDASALVSRGSRAGETDGGPAIRAAMEVRGPGMRTSTQAGGEIAVLPLRGAICPRASLLSMLLGGSSGMQGFRDAFREALTDDNVEAIVFDIDSPGGLIDLVPEACAEIRAARGVKPIVAVANTMAASAAYWIASQADELVVTPSGQVGSIGVFTIHEDFSKMEQMMGIATTIISAGPYKTDGNPYEPLSKTAQAALQDQVDQLYAMFTTDVAMGRGVKPQAVAAGYGSGRLLLAADALAVKMVDRIEPLEATLARLGGVSEEEGGAQAPECDMDDGDDEPDLSDCRPQSAVTDERQPVTVARTPRDYLSPQSALREQSYL